MKGVRPNDVHANAAVLDASMGTCTADMTLLEKDAKPFCQEPMR